MVQHGLKSLCDEISRFMSYQVIFPCVESRQALYSTRLKSNWLNIVVKNNYEVMSNFTFKSPHLHEFYQHKFPTGQTFDLS